MPKKLPTLYKRATTGKIQEWTIAVDGDGYFTIAGQVGGKLTTSKPTYAEPKNIGKSNETSASEQATLEAKAKWDYKLAHGYTENKEATDKTGYKEPMLAKQFDDYEDVVTYPVCVDDKLNGVRCNALVGSIKSRKGKDFNTIPHIVKTLAPLFAKYPGLFVDGELYNEALKNNLNRLIECVSVAYKPKDITPELLGRSEDIVRFYVYDGFGFDGITKETPFLERRAALKKLFKGIKYIVVLDYVVCKSKDEVKGMLQKAVKGDREGIIIRWGKCEYEFKRSKYLLKDKGFIDSEFKIKEIQEGEGNWAGCAKRIVLYLSKPITGRDGKEQIDFASNIEGDAVFLKKLLKNKKDAEGKMATVRFQCYSEYGVPQIPYVESIRDYE